MPVTKEDATKAFYAAKQFADDPEKVAKAESIRNAYVSQERQKTRKLFQDRDNHGLEGESLTAFNETFRFNPDEKYKSLNEQFFTKSLGIDGELFNANREEIQKQYSLKAWGQEVTDDKAIYDKIGEHLDTEDEIGIEARRSALSGESGIQAMARVRSDERFTELFKRPGGNDLLTQWTGVSEQTRSQLAPYRSLISTFSSELSTQMGTGESGEAKDDKWFLEQMMEVPKEDWNTVLSGIAASSGNNDADSQKSFLQKIGERFGRTVGTGINDAWSARQVQNIDRAKRSIVALGAPDQEIPDEYGYDVSPLLVGYRSSMQGRDIVDATTIPEHGTAEFSALPSESQAALLRLDKERDFTLLWGRINDIATGVVDPAETEGWIGRGVLGIASSTPNMLLMANPVGVAINVQGYQASATMDLIRENPGMSSSDAGSIGMASGVGQGLLDYIPFKVIQGKTPGLGKWLNKVTIQKSGLASRAATRIVGGSVAEGAQELAQEMTTPLIQELASVLSEDIPDVDWQERFSAFTGDANMSELIPTVVIMSMIGAGVGSIRDFNNGKAIASSTDALQLFGANAEEITLIQENIETGNIATAESVMREIDARENPDVKSSELKREQAARVAKVSEKIATQSELATEAIAKAEQSGILPAVGRTQDGWSIRFEDGSTQEFPTHEEAHTERMRFADENLIRVSEDVASAMRLAESQLEAGRAIAYEFTGKKETQLDRVNGGTLDRDAALDREAQSNQDQPVLKEEDQTIEEEYDDAFTQIELRALAEDDRLAASRILGENSTEFSEGVQRTVIKLNQGATFATVIEEKAEADFDLMLEDGRRDWLVSSMRNYEKASGDSIFSGSEISDGALREAYSNLAVSYFVGRSRKGESGDNQQSIRSGVFATKLRDLVRNSPLGALADGYALFFRSVLKRAAKLNKLRRDGALDADLERELARSVGFGEQQEYEAGVEAEAREFADNISGQKREPKTEGGAPFSVISNVDERIAEMFSPFQETPETRRLIALEAQKRSVDAAREWQPILNANRTLKSIEAERKQRKAQLIEDGADKKAAQAESKEWAEGAIHERNTTGSDRATLVGAMRTLDAMISALPVEVRGKIGGFVKLAEFKTPGAMLGELEKRTESMNRELERWLKKDADAGVRKLFEKIEKSRRLEAGKSAKGKNDPELYRLFDAVKTAYQSYSTEEGRSESDKIQSLIDSGNISTERIGYAMMQAELIPLFSGWNGRTEMQNGKRVRVSDAAGSEQRTLALKTLGDIWTAGKLEWQEKQAQIKERRDSAREQAISDIEKANKLRPRDIQRQLDKSRKGLPRRFGLNIMSFDGFFRWFLGDDSSVYQQITDGQRVAENAYTDGVRDINAGIETFFSELAGGNLKGQKLQFKMSEQTVSLKPTVGEARLLSQFEMITAKLMWRQEDGKRHMRGRTDENGKIVSDWSYDQGFMDQVEENLTTESQAVFEFLSDQYVKEWEGLNQVYQKVFGIDLPQHAFYSPLTVMPDQQASQAVDPLTGFFSGGLSGISGSFKTRGNATVEPDLKDALNVFIAHSMQMEHFKAFAEYSRELRAVTGKASFRNQIERAGGPDALKTLSTLLEDIDQGGIRSAGQYMAVSQTLERVGGRFAQAILFGKLQTIVMNATQIGAAALTMSPASYLKRMGKLITGQLDWFEALNTPYIKRRIDEMPPIIRQAMESGKGTAPNRLQDIAEKIGFGISASDGFFTAGTYVMVLDEQRAKGGKLGLEGSELDAWARNETERIVDRLAQPTRKGARSVYENTEARGAAKTIWNFASESRKNAALIQYAWSKGSSQEKLGTFFYAFVANALLAELFRTGWRDLRDEDEGEDDWNWKIILANTLLDPLYGIPIFGAPIQDTVKAGLGQKTFGGTFLDTGQNALPAIKRLLEGDYDSDEIENIVSDVNRVLGALALGSKNAAAAKTFGNILEDTAKVIDNLASD